LRACCSRASSRCFSLLYGAHRRRARNDPRDVRFPRPAKIKLLAISVLPAVRAHQLLCSRGKRQRRFIVAAHLKKQAGKAGWILLWLLGVPIPILVILFLLRGCT
jgi:hypothetical protein